MNNCTKIKNCSSIAATFFFFRGCTSLCFSFLFFVFVLFCFDFFFFSACAHFPLLFPSAAAFQKGVQLVFIIRIPSAVFSFKKGVKISSQLSKAYLNSIPIAIWFEAQLVKYFSSKHSFK